MGVDQAHVVQRADAPESRTPHDTLPLAHRARRKGRIRSTLHVVDANAHLFAAFTRFVGKAFGSQETIPVAHLEHLHRQRQLAQPFATEADAAAHVRQQLAAELANTVASIHADARRAGEPAMVVTVLDGPRPVVKTPTAVSRDASARAADQRAERARAAMRASPVGSQAWRAAARDLRSSASRVRRIDFREVHDIVAEEALTEDDYRFRAGQTLTIGSTNEGDLGIIRYLLVFRQRIGVEAFARMDVVVYSVDGDFLFISAGGLLTHQIARITGERLDLINLPAFHGAMPWAAIVNPVERVRVAFAIAFIAGQDYFAGAYGVALRKIIDDKKIDWPTLTVDALVQRCVRPNATTIAAGIDIAAARLHVGALVHRLVQVWSDGRDVPQAEHTRLYDAAVAHRPPPTTRAKSPMYPCANGLLSPVQLPSTIRTYNEAIWAAKTPIPPPVPPPPPPHRRDQPLKPRFTTFGTARHEGRRTDRQATRQANADSAAKSPPGPALPLFSAPAAAASSSAASASGPPSASAAPAAAASTSALPRASAPASDPLTTAARPSHRFDPATRAHDLARLNFQARRQHNREQRYISSQPFRQRLDQSRPMPDYGADRRADPLDLSEAPEPKSPKPPRKTKAADNKAPSKRDGDQANAGTRKVAKKRPKPPVVHIRGDGTIIPVNPRKSRESTGHASKESGKDKTAVASATHPQTSHRRLASAVFRTLLERPSAGIRSHEGFLLTRAEHASRLCAYLTVYPVLEGVLGYIADPARATADDQQRYLARAADRRGWMKDAVCMVAVSPELTALTTPRLLPADRRRLQSALVRQTSHLGLLAVRADDALCDHALVAAFKPKTLVAPATLEIRPHVDRAIVIAVDETLGRGPLQRGLPPILAIPRFDADWETDVQRIETDLVTSAKEAHAARLRRVMVDEVDRAIGALPSRHRLTARKAMRYRLVDALVEAIDSADVRPVQPSLLALVLPSTPSALVRELAEIIDDDKYRVDAADRRPLKQALGRTWGWAVSFRDRVIRIESRTSWAALYTSAANNWRTWPWEDVLARRGGRSAGIAISPEDGARNWIDLPHKLIVNLLIGGSTRFQNRVDWLRQHYPAVLAAAQLDVDAATRTSMDALGPLVFRRLMPVDRYTDSAGIVHGPRKLGNPDAFARMGLIVPFTDMLFDCSSLPRGSVPTGFARTDGHDIILNALDAFETSDAELPDARLVDPFSTFIAHATPSDHFNLSTLVEVDFGDELVPPLGADGLREAGYWDDDTPEFDWVRRQIIPTLSIDRPSPAPPQPTAAAASTSRASGPAAATDHSAPAAASLLKHRVIPRSGPSRPSLRILTSADLDRMHGRLFVDCRRFVQQGRTVQRVRGAAEKRKNGLPVSIRYIDPERLREEVIERGWATAANYDPCALRYAADDSGQVVSHAISYELDVNGERRIHDLLMSPRPKQSILSSHVRATAARRAELAKNLARHRPSPAILNMCTRVDWRAGALRHRKAAQWEAESDRAVDRTLAALGFPLNTAPRVNGPALVPLIFAIGASTSSAGSAHTVDQRSSFLRELNAEARRRGLPIIFVLVNEFRTTKSCADPTCRARHRRAHGTDSDNAYLQRANGSTCLRLLVCPACGTVRHRDSAAAENIIFVARHIAETGRHPFR